MGHVHSAVPTASPYGNNFRDGHHANPTLRFDAAEVPPRVDTLLYADFSAALRRELGPTSTLEDVLVDRVSLAAWRLHVQSIEDSISASQGVPLAPIDREMLRSECSLETALMLLETSRRAIGARWNHAVYPASKVVEEPAGDLEEQSDLLSDADQSNEWTRVPDLDFEPEYPKEETMSVPRIRWEDRLNFEESISDSSPVVKGTWVTVNQVVSLIVDGWNWSDVLRTHPELNEEDIRACLAYSVEQDERGEF